VRHLDILDIIEASSSQLLLSVLICDECAYPRNNFGARLVICGGYGNRKYYSYSLELIFIWSETWLYSFRGL